MRELKFRAWINIGVDPHMTYEVDDLDFKDREVYTMQCFAHMWGREAVVMQYTGLKDKNGVDIYEGDIVGRPDHIKTCWGMGEVMFRHGAFRVHAYVLFEIAGHTEVLGNIYENPELLKEKP